MTIEQAIKKSVEGGYLDFVNDGYTGKPRKWFIEFIDGTGHFHIDWGVGYEKEKTREKQITLVTTYSLFQDPNFWQCLGKALGWGKHKEIVINQNGYFDEQLHIYDDEAWLKETEEWLYHQHQFIDHLAEGKDMVDFFKDLE